MARKGKRPGGKAPTEAQQNSNDKGYNRSETEREAPSDYNPSGHFDPREPRSSRGRAKKLAENRSIREVGDDSAYEEYLEWAQSEVSWDNFVYWLGLTGWEHIDTYRYYDPTGYYVLYEVWRFHYKLLPSKKRFLPRHEENGKWVHGMPPVRVPYNLPQILKRPDEEITLVEGEKGANAVMKKGMLATCIHGQQWTSEAAAFLTDRTVNIAMDNDKSGRAHIETAREWLSQVNATVRVIELPGLPPGKGLDDWLENHSVEEYRELVAKTPIEGRISTAPHPFPAEETIERYDWLLGRHLLRGEVSATVGTGGTGKSTLAITEALSMASGKQLLHDFVPKRLLHVILVNLEDRRSTMDKRIAAAMRHHGSPPCPGSGWQLLASQGKRGVAGARGERGPTGLSGATIRDWKIDRARYVATPVMSDGSEGPPLELRELFEQFLADAG